MENYKWVISRVISPLNKTKGKQMYCAGGCSSMFWVEQGVWQIDLYNSYEELPKEISYSKGVLKRYERLYINETGEVCGIAKKIPISTLKRDRKYIIYFEILDYYKEEYSKPTPMYLNSKAKSSSLSESDNHWNIDLEMATTFEEKFLPPTLTIFSHRMTLKSYITNGDDGNLLAYEVSKDYSGYDEIPIRVSLLEVF